MPRRTSTRRREYEKGGEKGREKEAPPTRRILRWGINWYASSIRHVGRMKEGDSRQCLSANATPHRASGAFSRKLSEHRDTYQLIFTGRTVRYISCIRDSAILLDIRFDSFRLLNKTWNFEWILRKANSSLKLKFQYPFSLHRNINIVYM